MSLYTKLLVTAFAITPVFANAQTALTLAECDVLEAVGSITPECSALRKAAAQTGGASTTGGGLGLPSLTTVGVTNFGPALLPLALGGAAIAAVAFAGDDEGSASNGTN